jgi:signal transduction histidine kinase
MNFGNLKVFYRSSSVRLIILYSLLYISSSLILLSFIFWISIVYIEQQSDHHIEFDRKTLLSLYKQMGRESLMHSIHERFMHENFDSIYLLYDSQQNILAGNLTKIPDNLVSGWNQVSLDSCMCVKSEHSDRARVINKKIDQDLYFLNGLDVNANDSQKNRLIFIMGVGLIITIVMGAIGGIIVSRNTILKINLMNQKILDIKNGNLDLRIPHKDCDSDFDLLAKNINNMLDQIKLLITDIENMSNHISHDLRTPLTRMRAKLEQVLASADHQQAELVLDAIDEADTLLSAFNAILRISKVESGASKTAFTELSLNALINDVVDFYEPLANISNIKINTQLEDNLLINGDQDMMFQAIANLLDNAIKYSYHDSSIHISGRQNKRLVILQIADNGCGIPADDIDNVFKRFFQLSKHRGGEGHGLGLSLVGAIIKLHEAEIVLNDNQPGLLVEVRFLAFLPENNSGSNKR